MTYPFSPVPDYKYTNLTLDLPKYTPESELELQRMVEDWCIRNGGDPYVWDRISRGASVPDNRIHTPFGFEFYIEFKKPGGSTYAHQLLWIEKAVERGETIFIVDDADVGIAVCESLWGLTSSECSKGRASGIAKLLGMQFGRKGTRAGLMNSDVRVHSGQGQRSDDTY